MPGLNYTSEFGFDPWTDNVDRVTAAGDNGFNVRFAALEAEFQKIEDAGLEPASVRMSNVELVTAAQTTVNGLAAGATTNVSGPTVNVSPPGPLLPLATVSSTTPNGQFSVTNVYRMNATATQITLVVRIQNLGTEPLTVTVTPHLVRA